MENNELLLPCPFCGPGTNKQIYQHGPVEPDCFVQCDGCTTCGPSAKSRELAAEIWNRRTTAPAEKVADQSHVDWLGLALDLEQQAKCVESQTAERSMTAAAHGLRLMGASHNPAAPANAAAANGDGLLPRQVFASDEFYRSYLSEMAERYASHVGAQGGEDTQ